MSEPANTISQDELMVEAVAEIIAAAAVRKLADQRRERADQNQNDGAERATKIGATAA